ncbi:unnamed protein product, partial [Didymodactylos carnosus]
LNENAQRYLISEVNKNIQDLYTNEFINLIKLAIQRLQSIDDEKHRTTFLILLEMIFSSYIKKGIRNYPDHKLKDLLTIGIQISLNSVEQPYCLMLIESLVKFHSGTSTDTLYSPKIERLFTLIHELDNLCTRYDPSKIFKDEWFNSYVLIVPTGYVKLTRITYQNLCINQKSPWIIYVWKRLVHLSLAKYSPENNVSTLNSINRWLIDVGHHKYDPDNILTIIFVTNVFNTVTNYMKPLSLPNIEHIITYILHVIKNPQLSVQLDTNNIYRFIQEGQQAIRDILYLKGNILKLKMY